MGRREDVAPKSAPPPSILCTGMTTVESDRSIPCWCCCLDNMPGRMIASGCIFCDTAIEGVRNAAVVVVEVRDCDGRTIPTRRALLISRDNRQGKLAMIIDGASTLSDGVNESSE